ncbi:hypothetical protein [Kitasatospora sp. NPDC093806]|uniref:hypothetical protein n=1 Tax=Kitasatospora sp. NPDC093806 TaxID=3155075 RepID=UPI00341BF402
MSRTSHRALRVVALLAAVGIGSAALGATGTAQAAPTADGSTRAAAPHQTPGHSTDFTPTVENPTTATAEELSAAATGGKGSALPQAQDQSLAASSAAGGRITRNEVLARARSWVDQGVPYSQTAYWTDANGKYRQDCSGFVSMAWHLPSSGGNNYGETTWTLPTFATKLGSYDDLRPGDMIDNISSHVVLFTGWADSGHTVANIMEEARPGTNARASTYTRSYLSSGGYQPYRFNNIVDAQPTGIGVYRPGDQMFYEADRSGGVLGYNRFGVAKDVPLMGHWNAGPSDTMGIYRPSTSDFALSTDNATVWVNARFGNPGDIPVVGDWDGRGYTTIGVYRPTEQTFYLSNDNATVAHTIKMGNPGDTPIVGNWSGTGKTTIGVYRPGDQTFYLSNTNNAANVDHTIRFGNPGDIPIKGDWNGTGTDKVGVYRPDTSDFYGAGQDTNTVIFTMRFGNPGDQPITGNWS